MNKLEYGMYVRTKYSGVCKLHREFSEDSVDVGICVLPEINGFFIDEKEVDYIGRKDILKASFDIIDLIEVGDYVNGYYVSKIWKENEITHYVDGIPIKRKERKITIQAPSYGGIIHLENKAIKSVLTKEQFESMSYRIGE